MADEWAGKVKDFVSVASASIVIIAATITFIVWLGGGLKPGSQVQGEQMQMSMDRLSRQVSEMNAKLDAMPRPSDYAAQDAHMARLDAALEAVRQQLGRIDVDAATIKTRLDRLDGTPIRTPR